MKQNTTTSLFDITKTIQDVSQTGNLYGRLLELQDMQLTIVKRIAQLQKQINEVKNG